MNLKISNKVALIIGSSRGIGKQIALNLFEEGCLVILVARDEFELKKTAKEMPGSKYIVGDISINAEARKVINSAQEIYGGIDILITNVGSGKLKDNPDNFLEIWNNSFSVNFYSAINAIEYSFESLVKSKGSIVCISSICGVEHVHGAPINYGVAKAALNSYIKNSSFKFGSYGVRINAIAPGNVLFPGSVWEEKMRERPLEVNALIEKEVAMQRFGAPEDIAHAAAFLASPRSSNITGQIIVIDGGQVRSW